MNVKTSPDELPEHQHAIIRNFRIDEETLQLRGGATAIPTSGAIGATNTAGAKGVYVWYPDNGNRHILAAYPGAASSKIQVYAVHTSGATTLGGAFSTAQNIAMAGFRRFAYVSDGERRVLRTDGVSTAISPHLEEPGMPFYHIRTIRDRGRGRWDERWDDISGTPPHAGNYPEIAGPTGWGFPCWALSDNGTAAWTVGGTGMSGSIMTGLGGPVGGPESRWTLRLQGTASLATSAKCSYSYGTGGTTTMGGVHFWIKSSRLGAYMKLDFADSNGSVRIKDRVIHADQTGRWEWKQFMFDHLPRIDRENIASARFSVLDATNTFIMDITNIRVDGLQMGDYEVGASFYDATNARESPIGYIHSIRAERAAYKASAFSLPSLTSIDLDVDRVRWYRRGGASPEWRLAAEVPTATHAWDFGADIDMGNISREVPPPAPRAKFLVPFSATRMMALGGLDHADYVGGIPTAITFTASTDVTAMSNVNFAGISRGVEVFTYTASTAATADMPIRVELQSGGAAKRTGYIYGTSYVSRRWHTVLWTAMRVEASSGVYNLRFVNNTTTAPFIRLGSYTSGGKPSHYHLYEHPNRIWVSREGEPAWFDRYTQLDAIDEDGFVVDLPVVATEEITGAGPHGSDRLVFTNSQCFYVAGQSAADVSVLRLHSGIGSVNHDVIAECDDWTCWVAGRKGALRPYAFGPPLQTSSWIPAHDKGGFSRFGMDIEPILNQIVDPTKMSSTFAKGRWYLFFGETVTYDGNSYSAAVFDFATRSWVTDYADDTRVRNPRFATTLRDTDEVLLASPASGTAGTSMNLLWHYDTTQNRKDGTKPLTYLYESRQIGMQRAGQVRLRSTEIHGDAATAGTIVSHAMVDQATVGTLNYDPSSLNWHRKKRMDTVRGGVFEPVRRWGSDAQGYRVGVQIHGTASTAVIFRSINNYVDRKR